MGMNEEALQSAKAQLDDAVKAACPESDFGVDIAQKCRGSF